MVHLLTKKINNLCVVVSVFPGSDTEQMIVAPSQHGPMPLIFMEGASDHLPMVAMAQEMQEKVMPDMRFEVVKFASREHHSWIPEEIDNAG